MSSVFVITEVNNIAPAETLNIFPNPASTELSVSFERTTPARIQLHILDITGRETSFILEKRIEAGNQVIKMPLNLPNGIYIVDLRCDGNNIRSRLVIQK